MTIISCPQNYVREDEIRLLGQFFFKWPKGQNEESDKSVAKIKRKFNSFIEV